MFMTRSGHKIVLDDTDGSEKISIVTKDDKNKIVMDVAAPSINIETDGSITLKATGDISLAGANISIEADQEIKLKSGTDLKEEAGANLKAKASAQYEIQGTTVTVKGNPIQLN